MDKNALAKCLLTICRHIKDVLSEEPRLLKLKSPMYILGRFMNGPLQGSHRLEKYLNLEGFLENEIYLEKYWQITQRP